MSQANSTDQPARPKTCATCAHRSGTLASGTCMLSGFYLTTERKYQSACGADFQGWVQREPLLRRVKAWLYAA